MSFITDRRQLDFLLYETLGLERLFQTEKFGRYDKEAVTQILDTAQTIAEEKFLPFAAEADVQEPEFVDGKAILPASTKAALDAYAEAGFFSLSFPEKLGGLQAPWTVHMAVTGLFHTANLPVCNYALLTSAAANLLMTHGTTSLQDRYLTHMLEGRWFGTMCLSEPQAGSSLGDIRTLAEPAGDGSYRIRGSKMWISGGEQEISENIVNMVLAKTPGAPAGTKGISLFLVPKYRLDENGVPDQRNDITLAGLNHKMGQRGTVNCLLSFGDNDDCHGYMIGEPNRGLEYMFLMMNEARIGVGHASVSTALAGYLYSADYARNRPQGRPLDQRDPTQPQVPIIEHTDVKRMLMEQKVAIEGGMALSLYCAILVDTIGSTSDDADRRASAELLDLLTPVVKSWPSEHCLEANKWAMQILGGYGYTRDYPVERLYRDNRLNHIHEGTFGIQGLDLVRRKICGDRGRSVQALLAMMSETVQAANARTGLDSEAEALSKSIDNLQSVIATLLGCEDVNAQLANATPFLDGFGTVVIGWLWLKQALAAQAGLAANNPTGDEAVFLKGQLRAAKYFMHYKLPAADTQLALCATLDKTVAEASSDMF